MGLSWTRGYVHDDTHNFRDSPPGLAINKNANITCLKVYFVHRLTSRGGEDRNAIICDNVDLYISLLYMYMF